MHDYTMWSFISDTEIDDSRVVYADQYSKTHNIRPCRYLTYDSEAAAYYKLIGYDVVHGYWEVNTKTHVDIEGMVFVCSHSHSRFGKAAYTYKYKVFNKELVDKLRCDTRYYIVRMWTA